MAVRRWVNLARYDNAEALIATDCPPDNRNCLVIRNYFRSNLSQFGFKKLDRGLWLGGSASFKTSDLLAWFPGFDPKRDISEFDVASFLIGYEDLDLDDADAQLDALTGQAADTFAAKMASLRQAVSADALAGIMAQFPPTLDHVSPAPVSPDLRQAYLKSIGLQDNSSIAERGEYLVKIADQVRVEMASDIARYADLRDRQLQAISDYDLGVAFQGDCLHALRGNLQVKLSLVEVHRRNLEILSTALTELQHSGVPEASATVAVDQVAKPARPARLSKNPERVKAKIEDAGEKIGGARKDFYARSMTMDDLGSMNAREILEYVCKDNIWPSQSLQQYRDAGVDARVALFVQTLRRDLVGSIASPELASAYMELVLQLRDATGELYSVDDVSLFLDKLVDRGVICKEKSECSRYTTISLATRFGQVLRHDVKGMRFLNNFCYEPMRGFRKAKQNYEQRRYVLDGEAFEPRNLESNDFYRFMEKLKERANQRRQKTLESKPEGDDISSLTKRPHLAKIVRSGAPDARGGKDIQPEDFLGDFQFRAVEFGNWLPQGERQEVLNRAYDALSTLANILGVDKQFLSLGGTLAIGFGSRGVSRAAAHYEPARKVMNLTRLNGAGSLAHEFFHALDDCLGEHVKGLVLSESPGRSHYMNTSTYYATELFLSRLKSSRSAGRPSTVAQLGYLPEGLRRLVPIVNLVNSLSLRPLTQDEMRVAADASMQNHFYLVRDRLLGVLDNVHPSATAAEVGVIAEKMLGRLREEFGRGNLEALPELRFGASHPFVQHLESILEPGVCRSEIKDIGEALKVLVGLQKMLQDTQPNAFANSHFSHRTAYTQYVKGAANLDAGKSKPYWTTVHELAARAFESYVQDACAKRGWREDYLVHGTEEERFAGSDKSPYPVGNDRTVIAREFEAFIAMAHDELGTKFCSKDVPRARFG